MSDKLITPNKQILGGVFNNKPAIHLYEFKAWLKKDSIQRPAPDNSNVVLGRICAGSWVEAYPMVVERMKAICEQNKLEEDSWDMSYLALKEADLPVQ